MKRYTETERRAYIETWKKGTLSKTAYAKSIGIIPTTFYSWVKGNKTGKQSFVEISNTGICTDIQDMVIEKGSITIRIPLSAGMKELSTVFTALGVVS